MRSLLFKIHVLKSLKNYRLFYRVLPILSRTVALSIHYPYTFVHIFCSLCISYIREVMNHVCMDHITDQSDAAVSMKCRIRKRRPDIFAGLFCWILCILYINLLRYSPLLSLLWLLLPSPVHRKGSAHSGQIHRNNRLCLRSWNADPYNNRIIHS